jgi:NTE family protein
MASAKRQQEATATKPAARDDARPGELPGQVVLVLQGGGALGAYQVGVYEALHQAGIEPDWVIGTSIGAINGALIAGNAPERRLDQLHAFWDRIEKGSPLDGLRLWPGLPEVPGNWLANLGTVTQGVPSFFKPNAAAWRGVQANVGVEAASYYSTAPLYETLHSLVDFKRLREMAPRFTVGAVNACSGQMRYFDSRETPLSAAHVMASGALPPAFPAIRIDGEPYWDGGIYSNTPIEAVLDDHPRRSSLIFSVNVWPASGPEPESIWQVMGRQKEIQYASRADSHITRQRQIHHLRHIIRDLARQIADRQPLTPAQRELANWGCGTTMHIVRLLAPRLDGEDHTKDIDFTAAGIRARWQAGLSDAQQMLQRAPWRGPVDPMEGVVVHSVRR